MCGRDAGNSVNENVWEIHSMWPDTVVAVDVTFVRATWDTVQSKATRTSEGDRLGQWAEICKTVGVGVVYTADGRYRTERNRNENKWNRCQLNSLPSHRMTSTPTANGMISQMALRISFHWN